MRRRQNNEVKVNHERWLVSYADFVTLLFAFFVVMYSVSQVSESKYKILTETLEGVFQVKPKTIDSLDLNVVEEGAVLKDIAVSAPAVEKVGVKNLANLSDIKSNLESTLGEFIKQGTIVVSGDVSSFGNEQWIEISLSANVLFSSGEAALKQSAKSAFSDVAKILEPYDNSIEVSGHTDNVPINNALFSNNWSLSSARAVSVVNVLSVQGINPERLAAVGYGEFRPISVNSSVAGRQANRRVVLRVADHVTHTINTTNAFGEGDQAEQINAKPLEGGDKNVTTRSSGTDDLTSHIKGFGQDSPTLQPTFPNLPVLQTKGEAAPIEPVVLKGGGLLFTSDPSLPRSNLK